MLQKGVGCTTSRLVWLQAGTTPSPIVVNFSDGDDYASCSSCASRAKDGGGFANVGPLARSQNSAAQPASARHRRCAHLVSIWRSSLWLYAAQWFHWKEPQVLLLVQSK